MKKKDEISSICCKLIQYNTIHLMMLHTLAFRETDKKKQTVFEQPLVTI